MRRSSILLILGLLLPFTTSANGGIKEVAEGKYMVNLSAAPIAPFVGEKQSMLIGFADILGNLIEKEISVDLTLKFERLPIFEKKNLTADHGVLPFTYIYEKPGIYELFVAFRLPDEPDHTYMPEDFLIEVKEKDATAQTQSSPLLPFLGGGVVGLVLGAFLGRLISRSSSPPTV